MTLKRLIICLAFLSNLGWAQTLVRFPDTPVSTVSSQYSPLLQANLPPNSPVLAVCYSPANAVPCSNYATTFMANGTVCPNGAQDTPIPATSSSCQPTGDAQGNIGFWAYPGTYDYTVCIQNNCLGPYTVTLGGSGGSGGAPGPPFGSLQFNSAGTFAGSVCSQSGTTITCTGAFNVAGPFGIGSVIPSVCGTATACIGFNNGVTAGSPSVGQNYFRATSLGWTASINGNAEFLSAMSFPVQGSDSKVLSSGTVSGTASPLCTDANGGATTVGCTNGFPTTAQIGDALRYNVNGDSAWDAVNTTFKNSTVTVETGSLLAGGVYTQTATGLGSSSLNNPNTTDGYSLTYSASASASTSTVIGVDQGTGGNASVYGWGAFYRWTLRWSAGSTSGERCWLGLGNYSITGTTQEAYAMLGTVKYATNNPQVSTLAFRYTEGTDTSWQAISQIGGGGQTIVSTGVAVDTNPHYFDITSSGGTANFFIDHTLVATISTNVPTTTSGTGLGQGLFTQFWACDNENVATAISAKFYWMGTSTK